MAAHPYITGIATGYSLWLVPTTENDASTVLTSVIAETAASTSTPSFDPHLTLLAGIPLSGSLDAILHACQETSTHVAPIHVRLERAEARDNRFKCVFVHAERSPALLAAHATARGFCLPLCAGTVMPSADEYEPHMSIVYARVEEVSLLERQRICDAVAPRVVGLTLPLASLQLWRTEGDVHEWACIATFPLTARSVSE